MSEVAGVIASADDVLEGGFVGGDMCDGVKRSSLG